MAFGATLMVGVTASTTPPRFTRGLAPGCLGPRSSDTPNRSVAPNAPCAIEWMNEDALIGIGVAKTISTPLGSYIQFIRGPILLHEVSCEEAMKSARVFFPSAMFVRFEPLVPGDYSWAYQTRDESPRETLILDLDRPLDEIIAAMHPKTRYNIRLAEKKGVVVRYMSSEEFPLAWKLFEETARRDGFRLHPREHYLDLLRDSAFHLVGAFLGEELLAAHLMADAFGTRTYLHGASSSERRDVMAPYLLHWREISDAKEGGLQHYDFWGISKTNPKWAGITRFKLGFGGRTVSYPGTFDFPLRPFRYNVYRVLRSLRRFI